MIQFLTGHGWFRKHLKVANLEQDDTCRLCLEGIESPEHLFDDCPALAGVRLEIFGQKFPDRTPNRLDVRKLNAFVSVDSVRELIDIEQTLDATKNAA